MARAFADITFTNSVKAAQQRYGSREGNRGFELAEDPRNSLTQRDVLFIAERDSFYQATVGENGWPYVQHRGGEKGFLKVIDGRTLAYADFSGNRQYISVGNITADDRVSIILMDYAQRRRLKIWARASLLHQSDNPTLFSIFESENYKAPIERIVVLQVEAIEWNCPKHITPRFDEDEVKKILAPLIEENNLLRQRLAERNHTNGENHD